MERSAPTPPSSPVTRIDWRNLALLAVVHLVALGGLGIYLPVHGASMAALTIGVGLTALTIFSISAGYHRLFSHRAYEAHPVLRFLLLVVAAGAFQNSALAWARDHRRHHGSTDSPADPYNVRQGFWYAHIGWVIHKADPALAPAPVRDLERDPLVVWQDRHYALIGTTTGVVFPVLLGLLLGDPWGGFIIGGAVRLLVCYHATFSINSFAHRFGRQPYSNKDSSRDNVLTALISMGEGYHNFHHTFPADYRNGVRAYQFDPTKWALWLLAAVGLARNLRRTPAAAILRARLRMDMLRLEPWLPPAARPHLEKLRAGIALAVERWHDLVALYELRKSQAGVQTRETLADLRKEMRAAGRDLRAACASWQRVVRRPTRAATLLGA